MNVTFFLFMLLLFAAVLLLVWGVYVGWHTHRSPEAERIARRLRAVIGGDVRAEDVTIVKERRLAESPELDALLRRLPGVRMLDRMLLQAGATYLAAPLLALCGGGFVTGLVLGVWIHVPELALLPFALGVAVLSSALPYSLEMVALTRLPTRSFGTLLSLEPAFAALAGVALLGERLSLPQWLAIAAIIVAAAGTALSVRKPVAEPLVN